MSIKANIETGLAIKIEGKLGHYQTLPIEYLIKIAESLQELIYTLADLDISDDDRVDLNNFKIELSGYKKSSAIPEFILTPRVNLSLHADVERQRNQIANSVDNILSITNTGSFSKLIDLYPEHIRRNKIVESVYDFTNSFDTSPTSFGKMSNGGEFTPSYSLHKLKKDAKQKLLVEIPGIHTIEPEEHTEFREVLVTKNQNNKTSTKILNAIKKDGHSLSYTPDFIIANNRKYVFSIPIRSAFLREEDHYVIKNELLDIYAVGETEYDVEKDFNEEFDYLYQRLNSLNDNEMTERLKTIKTFVNHFVKSVGSW